MSASPAMIQAIEGYLADDENVVIIGELGIGLNPGARLVGNMLEDEKALRTAHIAFGSHEGLPGGQNRSRMHIDYLFHRPTITATRTGGTWDGVRNPTALIHLRSFAVGDEVLVYHRG